MYKIETLHHITQDHIPGFTHAQLTKAACEAGVKWVQLRMKSLSDAEMKAQALETMNVCRKFDAKLIINDHVRLAKEIGADGVHLGKTDMSPKEARRILGNDFIIGGTANTFEDLVCLKEEGVDYIGLGPYRFTVTKENLSPVLGLNGYKTILNKFREIDPSIPIIGIGGILPEDVTALLGVGLHGVAVSSFINKADNKKEAVVKLLDSLQLVNN